MREMISRFLNLFEQIKLKVKVKYYEVISHFLNRFKQVKFNLKSFPSKLKHLIDKYKFSFKCVIGMYNEIKKYSEKRLQPLIY